MKTGTSKGRRSMNVEIGRPSVGDALVISTMPDRKRPGLYHRVGNTFTPLASGLTEDAAERLAKVLCDFLLPQMTRGQPTVGEAKEER